MTTRDESLRTPLLRLALAFLVLLVTFWLHDRAGEREARQAQAERSVQR